MFMAEIKGYKMHPTVPKKEFVSILKLIINYQCFMITFNCCYMSLHSVFVISHLCEEKDAMV